MNPIEDQWILALKLRFLGLFKRSKTDRWAGEIRCEQGWEQILVELFQGFKGLTNPKLRVVQVKEKFGGQRVYMAGGRLRDTEETPRLIGIAVAATDVTCERCGAPGVLRQRRWLMVACDRCQAERGPEYHESTELVVANGTEVATICPRCGCVGKGDQPPKCGCERVVPHGAK